ncbi:MAG: MGDG synthase family glycosyltransferase [Anaerolineae bacterium]
MLILTADIGFGHRRAANAIAAALTERYGRHCAVEIVNPLQDERVPGWLRNSQADYDRIVREAPDLYRRSYEASDLRVASRIVESASALILLDVMRDLLRRRRVDVVIITYGLFQAAVRLATGGRKHYVPMVTVVTDMAAVHRLWFYPKVDLCIAPTTRVAALAQQEGVPAERIRIVGIPVHPDFLREARPLAALRAELGLLPDRPVLLAVGSKRVSGLEAALRALNHSGLPLQIVAVAGGDDDLYRRLQEAQWHVPVRVLNYVERMAPLLHAADCVLAKAGGLMAAEALACGKPLILIDVLPGQEVGNAEYCVAGGAAERAADALGALEIVHHWLADGGVLLRQRAEAALRLGRPRAAYEVAELVWGLMGQASDGEHHRP